MDQSGEDPISKEKEKREAIRREENRAFDELMTVLNRAIARNKQPQEVAQNNITGQVEVIGEQNKISDDQQTGDTPGCSSCPPSEYEPLIEMEMTESEAIRAKKQAIRDESDYQSSPKPNLPARVARMSQSQPEASRKTTLASRMQASRPDIRKETSTETAVTQKSPVKQSTTAIASSSRLASSSPAITLSSLGRIPKRSDALSDFFGTPEISTSRSSEDSTRKPPHELDWYFSIPTRQALKPGEGEIKVKLCQIKDMMEKCESATSPDQIFDKMRDELHDLEFLEVEGRILRAAFMLHDKYGLPRLFKPEFSKGVDYPWDIRADAQELYNKWVHQVFDPSLIRGIAINGLGKDKGRISQRIEENYGLKVSANYFGNGKLVNGQWWPSQLCALRDGAHGSSQGGIYGVKGKGAFSIVLAGSHYEDEDYGEEIWYCGTDGFNESSEQTKLMQESHKKNNPVRVLRSSLLQKSKSAYGPSHGFRYDGTYRIRGSKELSSDMGKHRMLFRLVRDEGQDPIRDSSLALGARPTKREIREFLKIKKLIAGGDCGEI